MDFMDIMDNQKNTKDPRAGWPRVQVEPVAWSQFKAAASLRGIPAYKLLEGVLRVAVNSEEVLDAATKDRESPGKD